VLTLIGVAALAWSGPLARAGDVVVLLSADVPAYRNAVEGFEKAGHHVVKTYNMKGDFNRAQEYLNEIDRDVQPDLVYAVGIWALQATAQHKMKVPVVYAMVLNPPSVVGPDPQKVTGASMNVAPDQILHILKKLKPDIKRVGTMYDPKDTGFLVEDAQAAAKELGVTLVAKKITPEHDAVAALAELQQEKIDALWVMPDKAVLAPKVVEQMLLMSYRRKIPVVGISPRHAQMGMLLSLSFASSEDIGRQAGELASRVISGEAAGKLRYTMVRKVNLIVNLKAARQLGLDVPDSILKDADEIIR
jgi:ABC-type uncharacterized transport system substrate-binding protein